MDFKGQESVRRSPKDLEDGPAVSVGANVTSPDRALPASVATMRRRDLPREGPLAWVATLRQAAAALGEWITAEPGEEDRAAAAAIAAKVTEATTFRFVDTHRVLRRLSVGGQKLEPGDYTDAGDWPIDVRLNLEADGSIVPVPHDPVAALRGCAMRARLRLDLLKTQRVETERRLESAREETWLLRAVLDELDRLVGLHEDLERRFHAARQEVTGAEEALAHQLPAQLAATQTRLAECERALQNFPKDGRE